MSMLSFFDSLLTGKSNKESSKNDNVSRPVPAISKTPKSLQPQANFNQVMSGSLGTNTYYDRMLLSSQSYGAKYPGGLSSPFPVIIHNHRALRAQARYAYHDSELGHMLVDRYTDIIIETGLSLQPTPLIKILGISQDEGMKWSDMVKERYKLWACSKKQHRSGILSFEQAQKVYTRSQVVDGEAFIRCYYSQDSDLINPLQFEFIDADQIDGTGFTSTYGNIFFVDDGIIRKPDGREHAYRINLTNKKTGEQDIVELPAFAEKSRMPIVLHGYKRIFTNQLRGYPRITHVLQQLGDLSTYDLSQLAAAINQSQIYMYVKPSPELPSSNPMDGQNRNLFAAGSNLPDTPSGTEPSNVNFQAFTESTFTRPGSAFMANLGPGEDLGTVSNTAPHQQYDKFRNTQASYIAASLGIPLEVLLMQFNQNYSASRAAIGYSAKVAQNERQEIKIDFLTPMYQIWLNLEIAAGRIKAPGWSDPVLRAAWSNVLWDEPPIVSIDPLKLAQANKLNAEMGLETLEESARKLNGSSARENREKLAQEFAQLAKAPWTTQQSTQNGKNDNKDDDESSEE